MDNDLYILLITAGSIGFFHTLFGPDHYLPFIVMAKSKKWSSIKTLSITFACGIGHVLSSVILGLIGVTLGITVEKLQWFDSARGGWAAWVLIAFGLTYMVYGIHQALRNKTHTHPHIHGDHAHEHGHIHGHNHSHSHSSSKIAPWGLFIIFVLGPCEPLIPMLMYPAAQKSFTGMLLVASVFSVATIGTMLGVVFAGTFGLNFLPLKKFERFSHALAGSIILFCGLAIRFLGL